MIVLTEGDDLIRIAKASIKIPTKSHLVEFRHELEFNFYISAFTRADL